MFFLSIEKALILQPFRHRSEEGKKDGGLCPIIDLCLLNRAIKCFQFKMLIIKQIMSQISMRTGLSR